jgi:hypothetical protein
MPNPLSNTTTTTNYKNTIHGGGGYYSGGWLQISNNPVDVLLTASPIAGPRDENQYESLGILPSLVPILAGTDEYVVSIQIRSSNSASPAQVSGNLTAAGRAGLGSGSLLSGTVSPSGSYTPPTVVNGILVTGTVDANGAILFGTGFSVVHTAPGRYQITYTTPLAAVPAVLVSPNNDGITAAQQANTTGIQIALDTSSTGIGADIRFTFVSFLMV